MTTEFSTPAPSQPLPVPNLARILYRNAEQKPNSVSVRKRVNGTWEDRTAAEYLEEVKAVAKGLIAKGVGPGDRVVIISRTRYEWSLVAWAIWLSGAATVPIYETSSSDQCDWILTDSDATLAIAENDELKSTLTSSTEWSGEVLTIDGGLVEELTAAGADISDQQVEDASLKATEEDLATLIYTSGTTGRPKGCTILHGGFGGVVNSVDQVLGVAFKEDSATIIFLPLAHVLARILEIACFYKGVTVSHEPDTTKIVERLPEVKPTFLVSVPRVLEKVYNGAAAKAENAGGLKAKIFRMATNAAIDHSKAQQAGRSPGLGTSIKHFLGAKLVYTKLHDALGGRCEYVISGGSPLGDRLGHFFTGAGFGLIEGYGLTESSGVLTVNPPGETRIGTVGKPIPGVTIKIEEDGEITAKAKTLFKGYWQNDEANEASWTGEWYHTGDIGELDDDGYLSITGRKKDIIVTAGGKNVAPSQLEDVISANPLISQAIVVGDNRNYIGALITIDPETFPAWAERHGKTGDLKDMLTDGDLVASVQESVDKANATVSRAESIRKFKILPVDFSVETGELTPTMKLKRKVVHERFADEIENLYA